MASTAQAPAALCGRAPRARTAASGRAALAATRAPQRHKRRSQRLHPVTASRGVAQGVPPPPPPAGGVPASGSLWMGIAMGFQAAALIGAVVTGVLARRRRKETQGLNDKLRAINAELRRQREAQESLLTAVGGRGEAAAGAPDTDAQAAAEALEALRRQEELLQQERSLLEAALSSPSAAHPTEGYGADGLSISGARRAIHQAIRGGKEAVRDGRPAEALPQVARGLQLARETADLRAERGLLRVRAYALAETGDPAGALADLQQAVALSRRLGEAPGSDDFGMMGDLLTEMGDFEAAGRMYDACIQQLSTTGDA